MRYLDRNLTDIPSLTESYHRTLNCAEVARVLGITHKQAYYRLRNLGDRKHATDDEIEALITQGIGTKDIVTMLRTYRERIKKHHEILIARGDLPKDHKMRDNTPSVHVGERFMRTRGRREPELVEVAKVGRRYFYVNLVGSTDKTTLSRFTLSEHRYDGDESKQILMAV